MATLEEVSKEILGKLHLLNQLGRAVGSDLFTLTKRRIFDDGINSDGGKIGEYSHKTISIKKSKGRFTSSNVNLRNTEMLANSYTFEVTKNTTLLGFRAGSSDGVSNTEKIKKIEEQYGKVFELTTSESKEINNIIADTLDRLYG